MKQILKRATALALTGALCLGLSACGDKSDSTTDTASIPALAQELGYGYTAAYQDLSEIDVDYIDSSYVSMAEGKLYYGGQRYDDSDSGAQPVLYCTDPTTGETTQIPTPTVETTDNSSSYVNALQVCPDGSSYWVILYTFTFDDAETSTTAEAASDEAALEAAAAAGAEAEASAAEEAVADGAESSIDEAYTVSEDSYEATGADSSYSSNYIAAKYDMEGNELSRFALDEKVDDPDSFYFQTLSVNADGDLIVAAESNIYTFGADGTLKNNVSIGESYIVSMTTSGNGDVLLTYFSSSGNDYSNKLARLENDSISDPIEVTGINLESASYIYPGNGNTILASDSNYLYSIDLSSGTATKTLSWLDSDINASNIYGIAAPSDESLLVLTCTYHNNSSTTYELGCLTKTTADQLPKRTIITLGAEYLSDTVRNAVIAYNRKSNDYRISLVDYSQYNTDDDASLAQDQLDKDIISGDCPDIIFLSTGNEARYISKGALADLTSLLEKDADFSQDDLVSAALKAYISDGKLYGIPMSFGIQTLIASKALVGDKTSWTMAEMADIISGLDDSTQVMMYYTQSSFLTTMARINLAEYVDYGNATCSFDSDSFKNLLTASARLMTDEEQNQLMDDAIDVSSDDEFSRLQSGDLLMTSNYLWGGSYSLQEYYSVYNEEHGLVPIGYPVEEGNGTMVSVSYGLAISSRSSHIDAAWDFIKTMLDDTTQLDTSDFPVTWSALNSLLQSAMEVETYEDENGETVIAENTTYIGDTEYTLSPLTQEQVDNFKSLLENASIAGAYDDDIISVISENAAAYFSGDKSADEVAKLIQNQVSIYLGEIS